MAMRNVTDVTDGGRKPSADLRMFTPLIAIAAATGLLIWFQSQSLSTALMTGLFAAGVARFGFGIGAATPAPAAASGDPARHLADNARNNIDQIATRAASVGDDEVNFRATRLKNTVTLLIEALQADPGRHGELQAHLGYTLDRLTDAVDQFAEKYSATRNGGLRGEFLRYLQEAELQFEYVARSFMLSRHRGFKGVSD